MNALRHRNFRLLFGARTISFFGTNLVPIAVAFAVLDISGSVSAVGVAFAARTFAQISALLVGGVVADRFPRRTVMIGSDLSNLAIQLVLGGLLVTGNATVWSVVLLQAAGGAAAAFHSPASVGLVPQTVPAEQLQQANGFMSIARYSAAIFGAAAGGALVATIGAGWAILLDGTTYAASAALLSAMRLPGAAARVVAPRLLRDLHEGWQAFVEHTWVWLLAVWIAVFFLISYAPFFVLGPYLAKQDMGGAGAWAVVLTGEAIGALCGGLAAIRFRPSRPMLVCVLVFTLDSLQLILLAEGAPFARDRRGCVAGGLRVRLRQRDLRDGPPAHDRPRQALAGELVQLDRRHVGAAARLRDRRPCRERDRRLDLPLDRRDLGRRERDRRRARAERAQPPDRPPRPGRPRPRSRASRLHLRGASSRRRAASSRR